MVAFESSRGLVGGFFVSFRSSLGGVEGGELEGSGVGRIGFRFFRGRRELKVEIGFFLVFRVFLGGVLFFFFSKLIVSIFLCRSGYRFLGVSCYGGRSRVICL